MIIPTILLCLFVLCITIILFAIAYRVSSDSHKVRIQDQQKQDDMYHMVRILYEKHERDMKNHGSDQS